MRPLRPPRTRQVQPRSCSATPSMTRPNKCSWAWRAGRAPGPSPGCGRPAAGCCARSWACGARTPWRSAGWRTWSPGTTRPTPIPCTRVPGPGLRCCPCWRTSLAPALPNRSPARPRSCSSTPITWRTWRTTPFERLRQQTGEEISLPEAGLRDLAPAVRFRVIAKAAAAVGGQQPSYQRLLAAEALLRRQGSAGPVELPGAVSVYRLSLAQLLAAEPSAAGVPREAARCGKLVFRPQQPPRN